MNNGAQWIWNKNSSDISFDSRYIKFDLFLLVRNYIHFCNSKKVNSKREEKYVVDPGGTKTKLVFITWLICFRYLVSAVYLSLNFCTRSPQATLRGKMGDYRQHGVSEYDEGLMMAMIVMIAVADQGKSR